MQPSQRVDVSEPQAISRPLRRRVLWWTAGTVAGLALLAAGVFYHLTYVPPDLDLSATHLSKQGIYKVSYAARRDAVPLNQIHSWTLHVETAGGRPVQGAVIAVDGDMPRHLHGLPTRPQVTKELGNGDYLVEGMKFHMSGWWVVDFQIDADGKRDVVRFNLVLP